MITKLSASSIFYKLTDKLNVCRGRSSADTSLLLRVILKTTQKSLKLHQCGIIVNMNV